MLYTFYGDDFTGSTDVLEQLTANGVPSALFLAPPTPAELSRFEGIRAFGIAGDSRSRSPSWMADHLPKIFTQLHSYDAPVLHYKVCSTFDSAPVIGNIGRVLEIGSSTVAPAFVPIVVGAPHLRRFVRGGELFASAPNGTIQRIDQHPMSRHPVTPMQEADLRKHLTEQTSLSIGLIEHSSMESAASIQQAVFDCIEKGDKAVLFDTTQETDLATIGHFLWQDAERSPMFAVGSSGLTAALIHAWRQNGLIGPPVYSFAPPSASPLLVLSGSCAEVTAKQIHWALANGFTGIKIDPSRMGKDMDNYASQLIATASAALAAGQNTLLYTATGSPTADAGGASLGSALGKLLSKLLNSIPLRRVVICGGDTSSHAVAELNLFALTWLCSLQPGAPLCEAHARDVCTPALELILKGGQVGSEDFFRYAQG